MALLCKVIFLSVIFTSLMQVALSRQPPGSNAQVGFDKTGGLLNFTIKSAAEVLSFENMLRKSNELISNQGLRFHNVSQECANTVKHIFAELRNPKARTTITKNWLAQILDSWPKPPSGILTGNYYWLGSYQQCLDVIVPNNSTNDKYTGEYCLINIRPKKRILNSLVKQADIDFSGNIGMCFLSTCTFQDKSILLNYTLTPLKDIVEVKMSNRNCQTKQKEPMDPITVALVQVEVLSIFIFYGGLIILTFGLLVALSTVLELWSYLKNSDLSEDHQSGQDMEILASFSAIRSLKAIFSLKQNKELGAVNGIRALAIMCVIAGHVGLHCLMPYPYKNHLDVLKAFEHFMLQPFQFVASYQVNTFFVISGFLLASNFMEMSIAQNKSPNIIAFYLLRYLRLTPAMIIMLLFLSGPIYFLGDGPIWPSVYEIHVEPCRKLWWKSILYIQNFVSKGNICFREGWYMSADTQLYCLSPIILYPLHRKPVVGVLLMGLLFAITTILSMTLIGLKGQATFFGRHSSHNEAISYLDNFYRQSFYEAPSYIIGMAAGYIFHVIQKKRIIMSRKVIVSSWIYAIAQLLVILYGTYPYNKGSSFMAPWMYIMYGALARSAWALAVSWVILACATGHGGIVNSILTNPIYIIMGRLSFCAYLVHGGVLTYFFYGQKDGLNFSIYNYSIWAIGSIVVSMLAAIVLSVLIEMPIVDLMKQMKRKSEKKNRNPAKRKLKFTTAQHETEYEARVLLTDNCSQDEHEDQKS